MTESSEYDFIVIGGGPAGQGAAAVATLFGQRTLVIERKVLGGEVVTTGGAPTKTLRTAALYLTGFQDRDLYGLTAQVDTGRAVERMRSRTAQVCSEMQEATRSHFATLGIKVLYGAARLGPNRTVLVTPRDGEGQERVLSASRILLATGSHPSRPPNIPFDDPGIFDSESLPSLQGIPKSVVVIGGGAIGCEYASIFAAFGISVTLVDSSGRLLANMDSEMSQLAASVFENMGIRVALSSRVSATGRINGELHVTLDSGEVLRPDIVLFAAGRSVNTDGLGLAEAGVQINARGRVVVDEHFRTNVEGIYAAGDLIGPSLASISMEQGRVAACHAFGLGFKERLDPLPVSAVYSVPEIAAVGLTEDQAKEQGIGYEVGRCNFATLARGIISGHPEGMLKLVFRRDDRRLLGVHILGDIASELIALGQATIHGDGTIDLFNRLTFATPTYTMAYKFAAFDGLIRLANASGGPLTLATLDKAR
ncbi:MAG: FAD-dependent oxidoreductase [Deltaproteobacteria bacterium]|nr:FAD-dependent oxidoreductase [Deltaproteobacteria bacterium]MBI3386291.1 FAD-dependent oxidoreductase [Deltaproteobacteria bacterium]